MSEDSAKGSLQLRPIPMWPFLLYSALLALGSIYILWWSGLLGILLGGG